MARINITRVSTPLRTHEGAKATPTSILNQLRRSVLSCLLWEDNFYESGLSIAKRIDTLCAQVSSKDIAELALEARSTHHLRHVPLRLLLGLLPRKDINVANTITSVIQRPDEMTELLAMYWANNNNKKTLSAALKRGLARSFGKFSAFQLSRYRAEGKTIALCDVLRLVHPKPLDDEQSLTYRALTKGELKLSDTDTWESALSSGRDALTVWTELLAEKKLGGLALLRNLRNMRLVKVPIGLIENAIAAHSFARVLPFRFIAAARYAPDLEPVLEDAFIRVTKQLTELPGHTTLLVDVSGSMEGKLSNKSDMTRIDAACGLAMILRECCERVSIYTFSNKLVQCPPRRGFALRDNIIGSQLHEGTYLGGALNTLHAACNVERLIVITDEQSHDSIPTTIGGYCINVAPNTNGVTYTDKWCHIDGFSEGCVRYITALEEAYRNESNSTNQSKDITWE